MSKSYYKVGNKSFGGCGQSTDIGYDNKSKLHS